MKFSKNHLFLLVICLFYLNVFAEGEIPYLKKQGDATQLIVNGKPYLMLAGELGNSTASDMKYLDPYWQGFRNMHVNTILAPVYWELIEPKEGKFNFKIVDDLILKARENNIKLVLLWFGSWKNSMSCYAPEWIKEDYKKFPRARNEENKPEEILTAFEKNNLEADKYAFVELMKHIKRFDGNDRTVIMIQVENEIGMIPSARDYYSKANELYNSEVPKELMDYLSKNKNNLVPEFKEIWSKNNYQTNGTWEEIFGKGLQTDEIFMAWHYSKYTNEIAAAGKKAYPLPMYVNAALIRKGYLPGQYPSAGPLPHLFNIWRAGGSAIDLLSPDIYFPEFEKWVTKYDRFGNPLFIPEASNAQSAANAFYAFSEHNAMGYSPFSIESLTNRGNNNIEKGYSVLKQISTIILENQGKGTMAGALLDSVTQSMKVEMGNYIFTFKHAYSWGYSPKLEGAIPRFGGMLIKISDDEFIIAGIGLVVTFESKDKNYVAGIDRIDEGQYENGKWIAGRRLNGDQSHQGRHLSIGVNDYEIQKVKLYKYK